MTDVTDPFPIPDGFQWTDQVGSEWTNHGTDNVLVLGTWVGPKIQQVKVDDVVPTD